MYRGRVFTVPLYSVAAAEWLASPLHVFPRPGGCAVLHRPVPHSHRSVAVCSPTSTIVGCGRIANPWCDRHTHQRVSRLLWDGRAGICGLAVTASERSPYLGRFHRLGRRRVVDHQRRPPNRGVFPRRAAKTIFVSPVEAAFRVGWLDTHGHSFGPRAGRADFHRVSWLTGSKVAPRFECVAGSSRLEATEGACGIAGHSRRRHHFAPRCVMDGRIERKSEAPNDK